MAFSLQDPTDPEALHLLEALLSASREAQSGGAAFAWATPQGVRMLFEDHTFLRFLESGNFLLVVGVDAITTPPTLLMLNELETRLPRFSARVFLGIPGYSLFHPKFSWFRSGGTGRCVVGSGNLTRGGLWNNFEAFAELQMDASAITYLEAQWLDWLRRSENLLVATNHPTAIERAGRNIGRFPIGGATEPEEQVDRYENDEELTGPVVFIAEIPDAGNRWGQANVRRDDYLHYFGAAIGTQRRMLFRSVDPVGTLGEVEIRPSVEVASRNYRFELGAARGLPYPEAGRPIGVFVRVRARTFLYHLAMPGSEPHAELSTLLERSGATPPIRRALFTPADANEAAIVRVMLQLDRRSAFGDGGP